MKPFTVLVVLLVILAPGCGGDDDGGESSTTAAPVGVTPSGSPSRATTRTGTTPTRPAVPAVTQPNRKKKAPSRRAASNPDSRQVERYLRDNFGGAGGGTKSEWYDRVVEVSVSGTTTTVRTDLSDDRTGRKKAREICESVRGTIPGLTDAVLVTGLATHGELAKCVP